MGGVRPETCGVKLEWAVMKEGFEERLLGCGEGIRGVRRGEGIRGENWDWEGNWDCEPVSAVGERSCWDWSCGVWNTEDAGESGSFVMRGELDIISFQSE